MAAIISKFIEGDAPACKAGSNRSWDLYYILELE